MKINQFENTAEKTDIRDIHKRNIFIVKSNRDGKEITCLGGTVWITQEGDGQDRILTPGDIYQSRIPGDIIIEGLDHSKVRVSSLQKAEVIRNFSLTRHTQPACA